MRIKALFVLLLVGVAFTACSVYDNDQTTTVVSVSSEMSVSGPTVAEMRLARLNLHRVLTNEAVAIGALAPVTVQVTEQELLDLAVQEQEARTVFPGPKLVGMVKPVFAAVDLAPVRLEALTSEPQLLELGAIKAVDDGFVYTTSVRSAGAQAVRVHISDLSLPANTELYMFNSDGEAHGPYVGMGPNDTGEFWTPSVEGFEIFVQVRHYGVTAQADLVSTWFVIDEVGHIAPSAVELGAVDEYNIGSQCYEAPCIENASCSDTSHMGGAESAVAHYQFVKKPYIYMCSGGLLADSDGSSDIPYFLTANHCVAKQKDANTAEFYFDFTQPCGTDCGNAETDATKVTGGGEILSTSSTSDYTFMRIMGTVPAGRVFLGFTNAAIAYNDGAGLFRLSHPSGGPLAYSTHDVDTAKGTCSSWPRGNWIYSTDTFGATEGGSSGSVVLNSAGQVVGQLSGGCGTNVSDDCDSANNATVDGALAAYFGQVSPWLGTGEPVPTCDEDPTICTAGELCCSGQCTAPACGVDADCDDGEGCTTDACSGGGTCGASCNNTWAACGLADSCCGPACDSGNDGDCPSCLPLGAACTDGIECCSNKCRGKPGAMICR
ncbi:trypsin-like serine peptidase [Myxococcota bacterium]